MKKMIFAAVAALAMISVSNVFANNSTRVNNNSTVLAADTTDTAKVEPSTPVVQPDTTATPTADSTHVAE